MEIAIIVGCALAIISLTYLGAGAWLRDRHRNEERRRARNGEDRG